MVIYGIYRKGQDDAPVYVGEAKDLNRRRITHLSHARTNPDRQKVTSWIREVGCDNIEIRELPGFESENEAVHFFGLNNLLNDVRPGPVIWTSEMDALLGTECDARVAKKLNVPRRKAASRRASLGIPPSNMKTTPFIIVRTHEEREQGENLVDIAERYNTSISTVQRILSERVARNARQHLRLLDVAKAEDRLPESVPQDLRRDDEGHLDPSGEKVALEDFARLYNESNSFMTFTLDPGGSAQVHFENTTA